MDRKVKVVQLITTMADGGAETLVKDYALLCDREKFDMTIVSWSEPLGSANERILKENGISVVFLGEKAVTSPTKNPLVKAFRRLKKYTDFRKLIISKDVDVIHVHLRFGIYTKILPKKILKKAKLFYTVHNEPERFFEPNGRGRKKSEFDEAKRLIEKFDMTMITLHSDMQARVKKMFDTDRVITVYNGINLGRFDRDKCDSSSIRKELGIDDECKVIGHVGSFTKQKNHEKLIDVFEKYLETNQSAVLLLIGKGVLKKEVMDNVQRRGLSDKVIFLENRSDVPDLMSIMDVFVLPSRWEGFPVVMIEAQAMGLKCVMSDAVTKDAILTDNVTVVGLNEDASSWIEAIDDKKVHHKQNGNLSDCDIKESIRKLEKLYCE